MWVGHFLKISAGEMQKNQRQTYFIEISQIWSI